jgi:hypothetical protein
MKVNFTATLFFLMALEPLWALDAFQSPDLFTIRRTPWTSDQLIARPLSKHRTAQTQNKATIPTSERGKTIHALLRPLGYGDRRPVTLPRYPLNMKLGVPQNRSGRGRKEKNLALPGLELPPLDRPACSKSPYRLGYRSCRFMDEQNTLLFNCRVKWIHFYVEKFRNNSCIK